MKIERTGILAGGIIIALIAAAGLVYYFFFFERPQPAPETQVAEEPAPEQEDISPEEYVEPIEVDLNQSDELVRDLARGLSSHPSVARWLVTQHLIRKFVAAVDNIAVGDSPRSHIDFFHPRGDFQVVEKDWEAFIDPGGYRRYDVIAESFASLDTKGFVTLYRQLTPAIKQAYRELGYPEADFDGAFHRAINALLEVPVVEERIAVQRDIITYRMLDPELEKLSSSQKHLLRMGPDNVRTIQAKLREIDEGLGYHE